MLPRPTVLQDRSGLALVMAIVVIFICSGILMGLVNYTVSEYRATHLDERKVQALYCAEAGIDYALGFIRNHEELPTVEVSMAEAGLPDAEGEFTLSSVPSATTPLNDEKTTLRVTSTAYVPSKADWEEGKGIRRTVVATVGAGLWSFGLDAVRAREGVDYGSNVQMTAVVDDSNHEVTDPSIDASVRVTGLGGTVGSVRSLAANKASVAGTVTAPGSVDISELKARQISQNNPDNHVPNAFPDRGTLGYDEGDPAELVWPPQPGTWAGDFLAEAQDGGTTLLPLGTITAPKYIELWGGGTLSGVTLKGPGTIFVHGNLGGGVTNGSPPAQLVVTGNFSGNLDYTCKRAPGAPVAPPLIIFGPDIECKGSATWDIGGPLYALNPNGTVLVNDSAMSIFGALISNGKVYFKSNGGTLGYPARFRGQRFTVPTAAVVRSYSTAYSKEGENADWEKVGQPTR